MSSVDDLEELIATRRLNGLNDNLYKEGTMSEEAFNELIDNIEVVAHLTIYGRKGIKENVKKLQARIKELEKENYTQKIELTENSIPIQKVIDKINYYDERIKHAKQIRDKEQEEFYIDLKRAFNKLLEDK